jgi:hypothetical protein
MQTHHQSNSSLGLIVFTAKKNLSRLFTRTNVMYSRKAFSSRVHLGVHKPSKLERFLDVLFDLVFSKKRVTNLVPSEELLKIFRRTLTKEKN